MGKTVTTPIARWMNLLILLENNRIMSAATIIGMTTSHAYGTVAAFKKHGWIKTTKTGRTVTVTYTSKGLKLVKLIKPLLKELNQLKV